MKGHIAKRPLIAALMLLLFLVFTGCGQDDETPEIVGTYSTENEAGNEEFQNEYSNQSAPIGGCAIPPTLYFTSMAEFLESQMAFRLGEVTGTMAATAESVNFAELEKFYLPVGVPEEYKLFRITVNEEVVALWFLPEEHLVSDDAMRWADSRQQHFLFNFSRWDLDFPMAGVLGSLRTNDVIIDDKYVFNGRNLLMWAESRELMIMYAPMQTAENISTEDLIKFTQTYTLDLTDTTAIEALLETLPPSHHQLTFNLGSTQDTLTYPEAINPIYVPVFANILHHIRENHNSFLTEEPVREGYIFGGWSLNESFTRLLMNRDGFLMPPHDAVLYARWQLE